MTGSSTGTRLLACVSCVAALGWSCGAASAAAPMASPADVPIESFFEPRVMFRPVLSPDGSAVALLIRDKRGRRELAIIDTADTHQATVAASFFDVDIVHVEWVDDHRLVFETTREGESAWNQRGSGLYAVDRDGSNQRDLIAPNWAHEPAPTGTNVVSRTLAPDHEFLRTLRNGSGDVIIAHVTHGDLQVGSGRYHVEASGLVPLRLDTRTGHATSLLRGQVPDHVFQWMIDDQGRVLAGMEGHEGVARLLVHEGDQWVERAHFARIGVSPGAFDVEEVASDGRVYARQTTRRASRDFALYRLDLSTGRTESDPVVSVEGYDYDGELIGDTARHKVLGVRYVSDAAGTAWFDPAWADVQKKIDALLPGRANWVYPAECGCSNHVLVASWSDHQPEAYYLYDRKEDRLSQFGAARPHIDATLMADMDLSGIQARDKMLLPVWVTKPHGKGPWPTVVLAHGGPAVRGWSWAWDGESQFLASRGYLVVAPEFRGSTGYGYTLYEAGLKQWGLKMQDDIADATRWAIDRGLAAPGRICIMGASYGGYAALMGLARYGDLYRCGIAASAVTDLPLMYATWWSDTPEESKSYDLPVILGDPVKDAAQLEATSPARLASKITQPLLLAHGSLDRRVPVEHATRMRDALQAAHAPLTWMLYPEEAHGWRKPETKFDWYRHVEEFLGDQIGSWAAVAKTAAPASAAASQVP